jgi:hypothetical protein
MFCFTPAAPLGAAKDLVVTGSYNRTRPHVRVRGDMG